MIDFQLVNPENADLCDVSKSQWYLGLHLAERIANWALKPFPDDGRLRVLEPSAGRGALVRPLVAAGHSVTAIDIDKNNADFLESDWAVDGVAVVHANFVAREDWPLFDLACINPPFEHGQTEQHVLHALRFAPRVVAHVPLTTLEGQERRSGLWSRAYLKRLVIHSSRPKYSGSRSGGQTAMCTIDVVRRPEGQPKNGRVAASGIEVEWWQ